MKAVILVLSMNFFSNVRIVLVRTSHPGNIGSAARAMKTMGLSQLYLVNPETPITDDSYSLAAGAKEVLDQASICSSLGEALQNVEFSIASSARRRTIERENLEPHAMGQLVCQVASEGKQVAVVFGCERTGLTNEELDLCNYHVTINANADYSSLNLAMAVQVLCYEIRLAALEQGAVSEVRVLPKSRTSPRFLEKQLLADGAELEGFYQHLDRVLRAIGFIEPNNTGGLMRKMKRIFTRPYLTKDDVNILRGILTAVTKSSGIELSLSSEPNKSSIADKVQERS